MNRRLLALMAVCIAAGFVFYSRRHSAPSPTAAPAAEVRSDAADSTQLLADGRQVKAPPAARPAADATATGRTVSSPPYVPPLAATAPDAAVTAALSASNAAIPAVPSDIAPATVLEKMRSAVRQYGDAFYGNPVGNNAEITAALNGENPKQVKFINAEYGLRINAQGELIDSWGTPFFFHQLSGTEMEIRSAGPDRKMWTQDDLVTK